MSTCILKLDDLPVWLKSLPSSFSSAVIILCGGEKNSEVEVPSIALLAASPLLRMLLSDHLPPPGGNSPVYLTIPVATHEVLLVVRDILVTGTGRAVPGDRKVKEVKQVFKMLMIEASLVCHQSKMVDVGGLLDNDAIVKKEEAVSVIGCKTVNDGMLETIKLEILDEVCEAEIYPIEPIKSSNRELIQDFEQNSNFLNLKTEMDECMTEEYNVEGENPGFESNDSSEVGKLLKCDICEYETNFSAMLSRHNKKHTGEKLFKHSGDKPYKCDQCPYEAARLANLKVHKLKHAGGKQWKQYKCYQCSYESLRMSNLKVHEMLKHARQKPHQCDQCAYLCADSNQLKRHKFNHSEEKPHKCDQCPYEAARLDSLKVHKTKHNTGK